MTTETITTPANVYFDAIVPAFQRRLEHHDILVDEHDAVLVFDAISDQWTTCHSLTESEMDHLRVLARDARRTGFTYSVA